MKAFLCRMVSLLLPADSESLDSHCSSAFLEGASRLISSGEPEGALAILFRCQPRADEVSSYHYAHAQTLEALKKPEPVERTRLAYLYAKGPEEKEGTLIERPEVYLTMTNYAEAALCSKILLKKFSESRSSAKSHLGPVKIRNVQERREKERNGWL